MEVKFHLRLRELRKERGLSAETASSVFGVTPRTYSSWERDEHRPDYETLVDMCKYFDVTADYMLGLSDERCTKKDAPAKDAPVQMVIPLDDPNVSTARDFEKVLEGIVDSILKKRGL